ncbi:MAG: hypothetical protein AAFW81_04445 [Pseudomonadota bacterium]
MTRLFDVYLIIDWSGANSPKRGKDSIWVAEVARNKGRIRSTTPVNPPTRAHAMALLAQRIDRHLGKGQRVFAGFDFPFGYPAGAAKTLTGRSGWRALWTMLAREVEDGEDNASNRFALAARWNEERLRAPHFWGRPHAREIPGLPATKPTGAAFRSREYRIVERWRPPAKSVWQLAYNGAVGSQAMLGMARLEALRKSYRSCCAIWPYETRWASRLDRPLTIAEVYPSMMTPKLKPGEVKDAAQVRTVASAYARLDSDGAFGDMLARPAGLSAKDNRAVLAEEGWIVGAGHEG